jgi:formylglycine-generating enzyme required for sulfatase activity
MKKNNLKPAVIALMFALFLAGCSAHHGKGGVVNKQAGNNLPDKYIAENDPEVMVLIPAGDFIMGNKEGSRDEQPEHRVFVDAFYIDSAEVTCERYERFLNDTEYPYHELWNPEYDRPDDAVVGVSWHDAFSFAQWAGKRLPTEAEWEKAARGGLAAKKFPWGNNLSKDAANYMSYGTVPVKSYDPNGYGLFDVTGNVWEWCQDWYSPDYYRISPRENPSGPLHGSKKVIRGGCWYCGETTLGISNRHKHELGHRSFNIGFRCVKSARDCKRTGTKAQRHKGTK